MQLGEKAREPVGRLAAHVEGLVVPHPHRNHQAVRPQLSDVDAAEAADEASRGDQ